MNRGIRRRERVQNGRRTVRHRLPTGMALGLLLALCASQAAADPILAVETFARETYYEGVPYDRAASLTAAQVDRLAEMLADPDEAPSHGNIVMALGMSGQPGAFAALSSFARAEPTGEVDRSAYRARTQVALAMGHLARTDPRALRWLFAELERSRRAPEWSFRHQHGSRLAEILEEQALTGLGLSGAPEAEAILAREAAVADGRRSRHAEHVRALHARVKHDGARAVFGGDPQ